MPKPPFGPKPNPRDWPPGYPDLLNYPTPEYRILLGEAGGTADQIYWAQPVIESEDEQTLGARYDPPYPEGGDEIARLRWWAGFTAAKVGWDIHVFVVKAELPDYVVEFNPDVAKLMATRGGYCFLISRVQLEGGVEPTLDEIDPRDDSYVTLYACQTYDEARVYLAGLRDYVRITSIGDRWPRF